MKKTILFLMLIMIGVGVLTPLVDIQAAIYLTQNVGEKCIGPKGIGDCTVCDIIRVIYNIGRLLFAMMAGISIIIFLWSSIGLIANWGNSEMIAANKKRIVNTVIAIAIILLAWLIVNVVIVYVLGADSSFFNHQHWYQGPNCGSG